MYNETIRLAKQGVDWDWIHDRVADDADLVKNTTQRVVAKALGAMKNYYEYDDFGQPSHSKDGAYPLRSNYEEGYNLSLTDDGDVAFRISAKPYKHVTGVLEGDDAHLDILETALSSDEWKDWHGRSSVPHWERRIACQHHQHRTDRSRHARHADGRWRGRERRQRSVDRAH